MSRDQYLYLYGNEIRRSLADHGILVLHPDAKNLVLYAITHQGLVKLLSVTETGRPVDEAEELKCASTALAQYQERAVFRQAMLAIRTAHLLKQQSRRK